MTETKVFVIAAVAVAVAIALVVAGVGVLAGLGWSLVSSGVLLAAESVAVAWYLLGGDSS